MEDLEKILNFTTLINKFRLEKRGLLVNGEDRWENDVEHSYSLAMLAWFFIDSFKINLNKDLAIKYALIHDLVEVYAGDTWIYTKDQNLLNTKKQREKEAEEKIKAEFPDMKDMNGLIETYEKLEDAESRFVYALDKIEPILNIYLDGGRSWKEKDISLQQIIESKIDKVSISPEVKAVFDSLAQALKEKQNSLFN